MSVQSSIRDKAREPNIQSANRRRVSIEVIPNILPALDALIILLCSLAGGIGYHLAIGGPLEILPQCGIGALASFIYILRMNGSDYYELQESTKPRVEIREILVCWFTTGLLLAFIAFLLKISATYSRGAFVIFYISRRWRCWEHVRLRRPFCHKL